MLTTQECIDLEVLLDHTGLHAVLSALEDIAHAKAAHIAGPTWQDKPLARHWTKAGRAINHVVASLPDVPGLV
jgi:hypothetical protein